MKKSILLAATLAFAATTHAQVYITEFFYQGASGTTGSQHEFVEITNFGSSSVNVTGWYFRDSTDLPATPFSLTGFGTIAAGESVIIADISETDFRTVWTTLAPSVRVLGGKTDPGLGRGDTIRIFDSTDALVDQLVYGDQVFSGTPRTQGITAVTTFANLGDNDYTGWFFSNASGANTTNLTSINGDIGNPGYLNAGAAIPEPSAFAALFGAFALGTALLRRRPRI